MTTPLRLPPPFDHVPVVLGPLSVDPASLTRLSRMVCADERTVVFDNELLAAAIHGVERVELDLRDGIHRDVAEAVLYGYVTRMLFLHSGMFNLHASLLRFDNGGTVRSVAVTGHSGSGKSTTVSTIARHHGAEILVDDVVPIAITDGVAIAHPFPRPVHLLPDAAQRLRLGAGEDAPVPDLGKVVVDLAVTAPGPTPIDHLVVLGHAADDATESLTVRTVRGAQRLRLVVRHSNVTGVASLGSRADAYVAWATAVASTVPMTQIVRRADVDTLDEVVAHVVQIGRAGD